MKIETKPGIYKITCVPTQKVYIGQSVNIKARLKAHRNHLKAGTHSNSHLQSAHDKYGFESFKFEPIEYLEDMNTLTSREEYWVNFFESLDKEKGFNLMIPGEATRHSEESKLKLSESTKLRALERPETMFNLAEFVREKGAWNKGIPMTEEQKEKLRQANTGRKLAGEQLEARRELMKEVNSRRKGIPLTEETKQKMSEAKKGKPSPNKGKSMSEEQKEKLKGKRTPEQVENIRLAQQKRRQKERAPEGAPELTSDCNLD